jgi:hypothetical protein
MTIKEFYLKNYPDDNLGLEINEKSTFAGLLYELLIESDIYHYIEVNDSIVRERVFRELANQIGRPYEYVYKLWNNF